MSQRTFRINAREVARRTDRGGEYRLLVTPGSLQSTQLIMGTASVGPGERVKAHKHDYSEEAFFVVRGSGRVVLDGREAVPIAAGDAVLVPRGVVHAIESVGDEPLDVVFASAPLAPHPRLGHTDVEPTDSNREK